MTVARSRYELPSDKDDLPRVARVLRETRQGRINVVHDLVLRQGTTATLIEDVDIGPSTAPLLIATNVVGMHLDYYVASRDRRSLWLAHDAPVGADAPFLLVLIG